VQTARILATTRAHTGRCAPFRCAALALAFSALALPAPLAFGEEPPARVTIQAQPRFERARARFAEGGAIDVSAELVGDTGAAIAAADVGIILRGAARGASLGACAPGDPSPRGGLIRSDDEGRLCVRVLGASANARVELTFAGDALHLPATAAVALQPAPSLPSLAFDAPSLELDLDQPTLRLRLSLSTPEGDAIPPIDLELHDAGRVIALSASDWRRSGNALSFGLDTSQLGAPGPARLVAQPAGPAPRARAETVALRVASVRLGARVGEQGPDGTTLEVWTETRVGPAPSGWIEVTGGGSEALGSAPLVQGRTELRLAGDARGQVTLHYRSDDPWWLPGEPLELSLEAGSPASPRRWPWLALLAPIGYICLRSLQRPAEPKARALPAPRPRPPAIAAELVVPVSGWVGSVVDAHDGQPIAGALVQASLPSFRGEASAHATFSDARGWFELPALQEPLPEGSRLRVWAPLHSEVDRPLPPHGRVSIALTTRRRAVLRRLVRWARGLGAPWFRGGDPTPGEIAGIAARRGDATTARWAEGIQAAAYGQAPVDEAVESALRAAEPPWQGTPRGDRHDD
jgi:hypothetical protein